MAQNSPCGDWEPYKDDKCIKLIDEKRPYDEAIKTCQQQESSSSLISIRSLKEQEFFSNLLFKTHKVLDAVWIGAKYSSNKFKWVDDSDVSFTNWAEGSPSNTTDKACVQMVSEGSSIGKWLDVPCSKKNFVVCQKMQSCSLSHLQKTLLDARKELNDSLEEVRKQTNNQQMKINNHETTINSQQSTINSQQIKINKHETTINSQQSTINSQQMKINNHETTINSQQSTINSQQIKINKHETTINSQQSTINSQQTKINNHETTINSQQSTINSQQTKINNHETTISNLQRNPVPIGFIYVQLPGQSQPIDLWKNVGWKDVTSEYAGLFFRAGGGQAAYFGYVQEENSPRLVRVNYYNRGPRYDYESVKIKNDGLESGVIKGTLLGRGDGQGYTFTVSSGEVRPRNMAMHIWKRVS